MSSAVALPWILAASAVLGGGAVFLLRSSSDRTAREIAESHLRTLDAADGILRHLEPIVPAGQTLLQMAAIRPISPELIADVAGLRRQAEAALRDAEAEPRAYEAMRQFDLDPDDLLRAARLFAVAATRLHEGAARYQPLEMMHGDARHASAQLSELSTKLAAVRGALEATRTRLQQVVTRKPLGLTPIFGWRPQVSK